MKNCWFSVQTTGRAILILMMLVSNATIIWFTLYYGDKCAVQICSIVICLLIMSAQLAGILTKKV